MKLESDIWNTEIRGEDGTTRRIAPLLPVGVEMARFDIVLDVRWRFENGREVVASIRGGLVVPDANPRASDIEASGDIASAIKFLCGVIPIWDLLPRVQLRTDISALSALLGLVAVWNAAYSHPAWLIQESIAHFEAIGQISMVR